MFFIALLLAAALSLAAAAGYFSVSGLSETYAASFYSIVVMGVCLEFSKVVLATFIHHYWHKIKFLLKTICCAMLFVLMVITSYGVFSHLIAAYQRDSVSLTDVNQKVDDQQKELDRLIARKQQMDDQIAKLPNTNSAAKARQNLIKSFGDEYTAVPNRINELSQKVSDLKSTKLTTESKIGPIIYMAKVLKQDPDSTIFWFTGLITIVFDPLAVLLVFAANMAIAHRKEEKELAEKPEPKVEPIELSPEIIERLQKLAGLDEPEPAVQEPEPEPPKDLQTEPQSNIMGDMYAELRNRKPVD